MLCLQPVGVTTGCPPALSWALWWVTGLPPVLGVGVVLGPSCLVPTESPGGASPLRPTRSSCQATHPLLAKGLVVPRHDTRCLCPIPSLLGMPCVRGTVAQSRPLEPRVLKAER